MTTETTTPEGVASNEGLGVTELKETMKYKTCELAGARLDQAVAQACGYLYDKNIDEDFVVLSLDPTLPRRTENVHREVCRAIIDGQERAFCPSSEWPHGGPIIDAKHFSAAVHWGSDFCGVEVREDAKPYTMFYGKDLLEAYMLAFVWWRLGEQVEL
jgi:hypothetical protein